MIHKKIYVTYDEFVNSPYDEIEKREMLGCILNEFRYQNQDKKEQQELSIEWDKVRRDPVKWNELVKKALK